MLRKFIIFLAFSLPSCIAASKNFQDDDFLNGTFPPGFIWGFATAAYQIEGGWDANGKAKSIWDTFTQRTFTTVIDRSTGDVACDSYHKYAEDVELLADVGADFYRFSIAWSRVLPYGAAGDPNPDGINYYNNLIDLLLARNITPFVTMYHWDLPQILQDKPYNGWPNEALVEQFVSYAKLLFETFGDRVKHWMTFNEPWNTCELGYGLGIQAPGVVGEATKAYQCAHNILKAHARTYKMYNETYREEQGGEVGIVIDSEWMEPVDENNPDHVEAAERALRFKHGWFAWPLFFGDYNDEMKWYVGNASEEEGRINSRLPKFDEETKEMLKGSLDFLGVNHYTTELVAPLFDCPIPGWWCDQRLSKHKDPSWETSAAVWLAKVPWGLRKLLNWIKDTYGNPKMYITENGWADKGGKDVPMDLEDKGRIDYFAEYINNVMKAVNVDGCNVHGYTAWSLLDNFEWVNGYTNRFGSYWVDFNATERTRIPKKSVEYLKQIFADNGFPNGDGREEETPPPEASTEPNTNEPPGTGPDDGTTTPGHANTLKFQLTFLFLTLIVYLFS